MPLWKNILGDAIAYSDNQLWLSDGGADALKW